VVLSQNGWSANDRSAIETYVIGKGTRVALRKGDAGFLLKHVADWFDANIKDIDDNYNSGELDDWGYAERPIRGGTALSNHASGTALDINATCWILGQQPTVYLSQEQVNKIHDHLRLYEGVIRWGGDYSGRKDPMHFEINSGAAEVARVAAKIRSLNNKEEDMPLNSDDLAKVKQVVTDVTSRVRAYPFVAFRNNENGAVVMAAPGYWLSVASPGYLTLYQVRGLVGAITDVAPNEFAHFRELFLAPQSGQVDSGALAKQLATLLPAADAALIASTVVQEMGSKLA
jgi:hypothetical protein